jgi:hypothetical protein
VSDGAVAFMIALAAGLAPLSRRCAACKAVFDPDLEQGGNINLVVALHRAGDVLVRVG